MSQSLFLKYPELKDLLQVIRQEVERATRPADQVILDDEDVMRMLKISKRKLQYLKSGLQIPFHTPTGGNRTYYLLSDILDWVKESRTESIANTRKF